MYSRRASVVCFFLRFWLFETHRISHRRDKGGSVPDWVHFDPDPETIFWHDYYAFEKNWSQREKFHFETDLGVALAENKRVQNVTKVFRKRLGEFFSQVASSYEAQRAIHLSGTSWQEKRASLLARTVGNPMCQAKGITGLVLPSDMGDIWFPENIEKNATLREVFASLYCFMKADEKNFDFHTVVTAVLESSSVREELNNVMDTAWLTKLAAHFNKPMYAEQNLHVFSAGLARLPDLVGLQMMHLDDWALKYFYVPGRDYSFRLGEHILEGVRKAARESTIGLKEFFNYTFSSVESLKLSNRERKAISQRKNVTEVSLTPESVAADWDSGAWYYCLDLGSTMECGGGGKVLKNSPLQPPKLVSGNILSQMKVETRFRMFAGVSGTTAVFHFLAKLLKFTESELVDLRLACLAWMLTAADHSFMEIMLAVEHFMPAGQKLGDVLARASEQDLAMASPSATVEIMMRALLH